MVTQRAESFRAAIPLRGAIRFARRQLRATDEWVPGITLALYRVACRVTAVSVADRLDVNKQRVSAMERDGCSIEAAGRYRAAVDQIAAEIEAATPAALR